MQAHQQSSAALSLKGMTLLDDPSLNRSTAFTPKERSALGLDGLLPPIVETLDQQATRAYEAFKKKDNDLELERLWSRPSRQQQNVRGNILQHMEKN